MTQKKFLNDESPLLKGLKRPTRKRGQLARTPYNIVTQSSYQGPDLEVTLGKSMTQPDEALGIRELLTRFTQGYPVLGRDDGYYEEEDLSHLDNLDFAERAEALEHYKEQVAYLTKLQQEQPPSTVEASEVRAPSEAEGSQATNV